MNPTTLRLIVAKEWKESFNSPMPYTFLVMFFLLAGWFFVWPLFLGGQATLSEFFGPMPLLLVFFIPALAMRLFAEEYKMGTIEPLATLPVRDTEIVLGKFLAVLGMWGMVIVLSGAYVVMLFALGRPDIGQILASFLGLFLLGGLYVAMGLFASSLTRNQMVGFLFGFVFCFAFFLFGKITQYLPGPVAATLTYMGVDSHFDGFLRGVVDTRDLVYFLSGIVLFLSATLASFNSRRWR